MNLYHGQTCKSKLKNSLTLLPYLPAKSTRWILDRVSRGMSDSSFACINVTVNMAWLLELVSFMWVLAVVRMEFPLTINSWNMKCCYSPWQVVTFNMYLITGNDLPDLDIRVLMNQVIGEVLDIRSKFWVFSHTQRVGSVLTALSKKVFHSFIVDLQVAHLYPKRQKENFQTKYNSKKITGVWKYAASITKRYSLVSSSGFPAFSHFWKQGFTDSWY